jgi:prepilin-type N-terminal cleavage/methylation domain-containing protein
MLQKFQSNQKGFTLIELMIVIAIIGILAAIAVPQFMAYRMRGYHSVTASDLRNWVAGEAAVMEDGACYGQSTFATNLNSPAGTGPGATLGVLIVGGRSAAEGRSASAALTGCMLTGGRNNSAGVEIPFGFPVGVGDGVKLRASVSVSATAPLFNDSYILISEHQKGIRIFAADSDVSTTIFFAEDELWNGTNPTVFNCGDWTPAAGTDEFSGQASGSAKITNWQVLK